MLPSLSRADRALARLDGATQLLPNPDLFVYAFMRQEAVLSSQIEGTQASLEDVFEYEAAADGGIKDDDITEVVNYLEAMKWGLDELDKIPVSLRLIRELHKKLLREGRGSERAPGEFRDNQNWIGPAGCKITEATFVPPSVPKMRAALDAWEKFIHAPGDLPELIKLALIHAQFETIHPFWDGNGRLGRMIITFLLCSEKILNRPILYLSLYFRLNKDEYYRRLQDVRDQGNWEGWIIYFLRGIEATSITALNSAQRITDLQKEMMHRLHSTVRSNKAPLLAEQLFFRPYIIINTVAKLLSVTHPTASSLVEKFEKLGYLRKVAPGRRRNQVYAFEPFLRILHTATDNLASVIEGKDHLAATDATQR
jgi:Fic family protein